MAVVLTFLTIQSSIKERKSAVIALILQTALFSFVATGAIVLFLFEENFVFHLITLYCIRDEKPLPSNPTKNKFFISSFIFYLDPFPLLLSEEYIA